MRADCVMEKCSTHVNYLENSLHDIKTPISIINIMLENIARCGGGGVFDDEQKRYLETTKKYAVKIMDILRDTNDYNKLIREGYCPNYEWVDINKLIGETVDSVRVMARRKNIDVAFTPTDVPKIMFTDGRAVERVILNLLSNAVKFASMGGYVQVSAFLLRNAVMVAVSDNGDGFSDEMLESGITRYNTIFNEHNPNGSGIGLSVVKELTEALGGSVKLENAAEGGAVVVVAFPTEQTNTETDDMQMQLI